MKVNEILEVVWKTQTVETEPEKIQAWPEIEPWSNRLYPLNKWSELESKPTVTSYTQ